MIEIRAYEPTDADALWRILEPVFRAGDTYAVEPDISENDAIAFWTGPPHKTFVAEAEAGPLGSYYIQPNQRGGGAHVCNCGFVTGAAARGRGVARAMLEHSLTFAAEAGFAAMQFNFVVASNERAIAIWKDYGFEIVGRLPGAFRPLNAAPVDALVMYKTL